VIKKGIQLNKRKLVNTVPYADDQILMATSEDELQKNGITIETYSKKIQNDYIQHTKKSMAVCGNNIQRVKIVIDDKIIEQVTEFKYLLTYSMEQSPS
jgi:hypothetical protein